VAMKNKETVGFLGSIMIHQIEKEAEQVLNMSFMRKMPSWEKFTNKLLATIKN